MDNLKLSVWEISAGSYKKFVIADKIDTVKQYFDIYDGYIVLRLDMEPTDEMERLIAKPLPPQKATEFTKLEYASLLMAQGMLSHYPDGLTHQEIAALKKTSVMLAKSVLEEANK